MNKSESFFVMAGQGANHWPDHQKEKPRMVSPGRWQDSRGLWGVIGRGKLRASSPNWPTAALYFARLCSQWYFADFRSKWEFWIGLYFAQFHSYFAHFCLNRHLRISG